MSEFYDSVVRNSAKEREEQEVHDRTVSVLDVHDQHNQQHANDQDECKENGINTNVFIVAVLDSRDKFSDPVDKNKAKQRNQQNVHTQHEVHSAKK